MDGEGSQGPGDAAEAALVEVLGCPEDRREAELERACAERPELAEALRTRWRALQGLGLAGVPPTQTVDGFPEALGDFDLLERLGAGGMGVVYRARQRSLGREVALKLLRPEALYFERARERFRRETAAVAALRHPGIVPVHAAGEAQGVPYFAMELVDGATLAELLARLRGRAPRSLAGADLDAALGPPAASPRPPLFDLDWGDACAELARQVAEALEHAHARGILHRDVKPSNVALTRDGRAQLFDFGLALGVEGERLTQSGGQLGTLHYMSPEQVRGEEVLDARTDVYSLGATLYELLTLEAPFEGASRVQLEARIGEGRCAPVRELNPRVSRELALVCAKAMEVEPQRRYASARAFADDLAAVLRRRPIAARAPTAGYRARRWLRRNPALASALLAGFGLFGVAPSVLWWRERLHGAELLESAQAEARALAAEAEAMGESRDAQRFLAELFETENPYRSGESEPTVRDALLRGAARLDALDASPRLEARIALGLAVALAYNALHADALPLAERALALEREHGFRLDDGEDRAVELVATCLNMLDRDAEAEPLLREALDGAREPEELARLRFALGRTLIDLGRVPEARDELERAREHYLESGVENREARMAIALRLAVANDRLNERARSLEEAEEGLRLARELFDEDHPAVAEGLSRCAQALVQLGDCANGIAEQERAQALIEGRFGRGSFYDLRFREDLALMLATCGDLPRAADVALELADLAAALYGPDDARTRRLETYAERYLELAESR